MTRMTDRLLTALACGVIATTVQLSLSTVTSPAPAGFVVFHLGITCTAHAGLALALSRRPAIWAAMAFGLPCLLAVVPAVYSAHGLPGTLGGLLPVMVAGLAWSRWGPDRPLLATLFGALIARHLGRLRFDFDLDKLTLADTVPRTPLIVIGLLVGLLVAARLLPRPGPRGTAVTGGLALLGVIALGPAGGETSYTPTRGNAGAPVVLIVLDTLRADRLRPYGAHADPMPRLTEFVERHAVRVAESTAASSWTVPAHGALFTGRMPPEHGAVMGRRSGRGATRLLPELPTLAELLSETGYWTVGVCANGLIGPLSGMNRGFDDFRNEPDPLFPLRNISPWTASRPVARLARWGPFTTLHFLSGRREGYYPRAATITDRALDMLASTGERSFFLFLNYLDPHKPYCPPSADVCQMPDIDHDRINARQDRLSETNRRLLTALYDQELTYLDGELGRLLDALQTHPRWDEMLVIITADHGEHLGENDILYHALGLYRQTLDIPLFIRLPVGWSAAERHALAGRMLQPVDVFASILDHAEVAQPTESDGMAWGVGRTTSRAWVDHSRPKHPRFKGVWRSIQDADWKLVEADEAWLLFDRRGDPWERTDVSAQHPEVVERLREALGPQTPIPDGKQSAEMIEALQEMGYIER